MSGTRLGVAALDQDPHCLESQRLLSSEIHEFATERLLIPPQRCARVSCAEVNMVKPERSRVLQQLQANAPRIVNHRIAATGHVPERTTT